jgi:hypothetical protein
MTTTNTSITGEAWSNNLVCPALGYLKVVTMREWDRATAFINGLTNLGWRRSTVEPFTNYNNGITKSYFADKFE